MAVVAGRPARPAHIHILFDPKQPTRTLGVDFDAFTGKLLSLTETGQGARLEDYTAGMDLIKAMDSETDDFGRAAPGVGRDANFAERVAAITDGAFEAAWALLEEADRHDDPNRSVTSENVLARAVYERAFDGDLYPQIVKTLLACPAECDPYVSEEFV